MYWKRGKLIPKEEMKDLYIRQGVNKKKIQKIYNCGLSIVNNSIKEYRLDNLYDRYVRYLFNIGLRQHEISEKINRDQAAISRRLNRLGVDGLKNRIERSQETIFNKYGVTNCQKLKSVREKTIKTNKGRYGYDSPLRIHNCHMTGLWEEIGEEALRKSMKSSRSFKEYKFPSGKIVDVQGYEPLCIDILLGDYNESDISVGSSGDVPIIEYIDTSGSKRKHYPDIYIKRENRIIEVKSIWTKTITKNLMEKYYSAKEKGFEYEIWVFDGNKELNEII